MNLKYGNLEKTLIPNLQGRNTDFAKSKYNFWEVLNRNGLSEEVKDKYRYFEYCVADRIDTELSTEEQNKLQILNFLFEFKSK